MQIFFVTFLIRVVLLFIIRFKMIFSNDVANFILQLVHTTTIEPSKLSNTSYDGVHTL